MRFFNEGRGEPWPPSADAAAYVSSLVGELRRADGGGGRLVDAASGWHQAAAGDVLSSHSYYGASVPRCAAAA